MLTVFESGDIQNTCLTPGEKLNIFEHLPMSLYTRVIHC